MIGLILKILLFLLLGILGIFVLGITLVLIAPIHYKIYFEHYGTVIYDIKVRYLKGIRADFVCQEEKKKHEVVFFGKKLYELKEVKKAKEENEQIIKKQPRPSGKAKKVESVAYKKQVTKAKITKAKVTKEIEAESKAVAQETKEKAQKKAEKVSYQQMKALLTNKKTYQVLKTLLIWLWQLGQYLWPKEWDFELVIGKDEPAETGELIAKLTMLYPLYGDHGIIRGDFEKPCLAGGCLAEGSFRLGGIIWRIISLICNPTIREMIKWTLKRRKEEEDGK